MIKLKNIVGEIEDLEIFKKMSYSWQTPDGTFKPINYSHGSTAHDIRRKTHEPNFNPKDDHIFELWKKHWNRIWYSGGTLYCHNEVEPPTDKQRVKLIDLAMRIDAVDVVYDYGEDSKILWSIHDVLQENSPTSNWDGGDI